MAVSPARSYAHSSYLLFVHEPAPGPGRNTGQGLNVCLVLSTQYEWSLAEQLSQLASGELSSCVLNGSPYYVF